MSREDLAKIEVLADRLDRDDQVMLIAHLMDQIRHRPGSNRPDLKDIWADKFPEDFDLDECLKEVRSGWRRKFDDISKTSR